MYYNVHILDCQSTHWWHLRATLALLLPVATPITDVGGGHRVRRHRRHTYLARYDPERPFHVNSLCSVRDFLPFPSPYFHSRYEVTSNVKGAD